MISQCVDNKTDTVFAENNSFSPESFAFDKRVAIVFDDMVSRSVPGYETIQLLVADLALHFNRKNLIYDLGCSTGNTILSLIKRTDKPLRLIGVDNSADMLAECKNKLINIPGHQIELVDEDLASRSLYQKGKADVVILNLVLQFVRPLLRAGIIKNAYRNIEHGGCLILVEKTIQKDADLNKLFIDYYHGYKKEMGYSELEISNKREALENKLIPFFLDENIALLKEAGFSHVSPFFQWMNFSGILAVKN